MFRQYDFINDNHRSNQAKGESKKKDDTAKRSLQDSSYELIAMMFGAPSFSCTLFHLFCGKYHPRVTWFNIFYT